jgi:hypothetical protein
MPSVSAELVSCLRRHGRTEVLFGTNNPVMTQNPALGELGPDEQARELFSLQK